LVILGHGEKRYNKISKRHGQGGEVVHLTQQWAVGTNPKKD